MLPSFLRFDHGVYTIVILSFLLPVDTSVLVLPSPLLEEFGIHQTEHRTFNTIRLRQLRTIHQQPLINALPVLPLRQPHVDMRRGKIVHVEPDIFVPAILDQLFIYISRQYYWI